MRIEGTPQHVLVTNIHSMAGAVRQPINVASLSAYIEKNVAGIKLPISLKQVLSRALLEDEHCLTSALV